MSKIAFNGDGGKTDEYGTLLWHQRVFTGEVAEGCVVAANASPSMGVRVQAGVFRIPTGVAPANYWYECAIDTINPGEALTVAAADPANPRRDYVVAYIDKAVSRTTSVTNNSNAVLKLKLVSGTAASSPSYPTSGQIQSSVGGTNPYIILAGVAVAAGATQITNSDITDLRSLVKLSSLATQIKRAPMYISGGSSTANLQALPDGTTNAVVFYGRVPEDYAGGDITLKYLMRPAGTGVAKLGLYVYRVREGQALLTIDNAVGVDKNFTSASAIVSSTRVLDDSNFQAGDCIRFQLQRIGADGVDTLATSLDVDSVIIEYLGLV